MTERNERSGLIGFLRNLFPREKPCAPAQPIRPIDDPDLTLLKRLAIEQAMRQTSTLNDEERNKLVENTKLLTIDLIAELLDVAPEDPTSLKFIREGERIVIFPSDSNHSHREYAVVNGMYHPDDAGLVRVTREDNCLYLYDESITLEIYPLHNPEDSLAREQTLNIAREIAPNIQISGEPRWKL